jgi:hypothetical protein
MLCVCALLWDSSHRSSLVADNSARVDLTCIKSVVVNTSRAEH